MELVDRWLTVFDEKACKTANSGNRCSKIYWKAAKVAAHYFDQGHEYVDVVFLGKTEVSLRHPIEDTNGLTPYWNSRVKQEGPRNVSTR
jgi:hypothetical protein